MTDPLTTYVLIGDDMKAVTYYDGPNYTVIRAKPGQSFQEATKDLKAPANIIVVCHGVPQRHDLFMWHAFDETTYTSEFVSYTDLFKRFPREGGNGISTVSADTKTGSYTERFLNGLPKGTTEVSSIGNCYAGNALDLSALKQAPPGMLVIPYSSASSTTYGGFDFAIATETKAPCTAADKIIELFDNFDPDEYRRSVEDCNKKRGTHENSDPEIALPSVIGIGGPNPKLLVLDDAVKHIGTQQPGFKPDAWTQAVSRVHKRFDTLNYGVLPDHTIGYRGLGVAEESALHTRIDAVAQHMRANQKPANAEERRIAYALAIAYMDESGELAQLIAQAKAPDPQAVATAKKMKADIAATLHPAIAHAPQPDNHTIQPPDGTPRGTRSVTIHAVGH